MAIRSSELQWYIPSGTNGLGTLAHSGTLADLFPAMSGANNRDLVVDYIKPIIIYNSSGLTLSSAKIFFKTIQAGGATYAIALDTLGVVSGAGTVVSNYENRPSSYSTPTTFAGGLALPASLGSGQAIGVWVRRTGANYAAGIVGEKNTLTIQGTTPA